jgi:transposase
LIKTSHPQQSLLTIISHHLAMKPLASEVKNQIIGMHRVKARNVDIAQECGLSASTVQSVISKFKLSGSVERKKPSGRPKILTSRDHRHLIRDIKRSQRLTTDQLTSKSTTKVGKCTIRRSLRNLGYNS